MVNIFKMKKRGTLRLIITVVAININTSVDDVSLDNKINLFNNY